MSRVVVNHGTAGPIVEVAADVTPAGRPLVGLIAAPRNGRGWTDLTPDEAEAVGRVLMQAAEETRAKRAGSSSGATS